MLLLVALALAAAAIHARPPHQMTLETGPVGGSYYLDGVAYQKFLAKRGITLILKPRPKSLEIINDVANAQAHVDAGFIAQDVSKSRNAPVFSVGQIELQPLFIFASAELGRRSVLADLRGRSIVMPPKDSATSDAAIRLFGLFDITEDNTRFSFMPLDQAIKELRAGRFDAGAFMLTPENPAIREMAADSGLHLVPVTDARAVATHLPFLREIRLPRGIYDIADAIPPDATPMLAAPVGMVVRKELHPFLLYSLLEAMTEAHRTSTLISSAGEFPTLTGSQLTVHPLAAEYFRSGVPWRYRELPDWMANLLDKYQAVLFVIFVLAGLYLAVRCVAAVCAILLEPLAIWIVRRAGQEQAPSRSRGPMLLAAEWLLDWHDSKPPGSASLAAVEGDGGKTA